MTVSELIAKLKELPQDAPVVIEGYEQLGTEDPHPEIKYVKPGLGTFDAVLYDEPVVRHWIDGQWKPVELTPVVRL